MRMTLPSLAPILAAGAAPAGTALPVHASWCGLKHAGGAVSAPRDAACRRQALCTYSTRT